ncbi:MAG: Sua5/YciO/YrdC/YwlC family protein, partial [Ruminococcus sp.]|nr:Sua5/YciO/YrdC/YwlC family protein [Ruminococcus sp.]
MNTILLENNIKDIMKAAEMIKQGKIVGIPTETVYGLCADARSAEAVKAVFRAKGRPAD